jgi:hypothetical protein
MGATHFLMKTLPRVASEMALHVLAYNLTRVMNIMGTGSRRSTVHDASTEAGPPASAKCLGRVPGRSGSQCDLWIPHAVFDLVVWWKAEGRAIRRARRALQLQRLDLPTTDEPFAAIIFCTADRQKVDKRTRSKWSRVLRYSAEYKSHSESLAAFVRRKGGINKCAARFNRCLGRGGQY